eukprot:SAG31_NODE_2379_length_5836_cov_4.527453_8_plen_123_part_00
MASRWECVGFVGLYLSEAHASDEWPLGTHVCVRRHRTVADRVTAAASFAEACGWKLPLYTDTMDDAFAAAFAAHPQRFFVFEDLSTACDPGRQARWVLKFVASGRHGGYDVQELGDFLKLRF